MAAPDRLRRRPEFLRVQRQAIKHVAPGLVLQAAARTDAPAARPRVGFTATRKIGGAVQRNRARRRLRAAVRAAAVGLMEGFDYVLIARADTATRPFAALLGDLRAGLAAVARRSGRTP